MPLVIGEGFEGWVLFFFPGLPFFFCDAPSETVLLKASSGLGLGGLERGGGGVKWFWFWFWFEGPLRNGVLAGGAALEFFRLRRGLRGPFGVVGVGVDIMTRKYGLINRQPGCRDDRRKYNPRKERRKNRRLNDAERYTKHQDEGIEKQVYFCKSSDRASTRAGDNHECEGSKLVSRGRFFGGDDGDVYLRGWVVEGND